METKRKIFLELTQYLLAIRAIVSVPLCVPGQNNFSFLPLIWTSFLIDNFAFRKGAFAERQMILFTYPVVRIETQPFTIRKFL